MACEVKVWVIVSLLVTVSVPPGLRSTVSGSKPLKMLLTTMAAESTPRWEAAGWCVVPEAPAAKVSAEPSRRASTPAAATPARTRVARSRRLGIWRLCGQPGRRRQRHEPLGPKIIPEEDAGRPVGGGR